jgi:CheY-like chemotaxis protein
MTTARRDRVLIIEDEALNRELLQAVLEGAGFETHCTDDAKQGLQLARRLHPDVVLMDVQLPEMDGLEATRALRADAATAMIPVVAVTAHVKKEDETRCLEAGCVLHVAKPVDTRELPALIRGVVARARGAGADRRSS